MSLVRTIAFALAAVVCCFVAPGAAFCQDDELLEEQAWEEPTDEGALLFGDIPSVFSASKYDQKVTEAPSLVSIVTASEIRRYGYRTLADILQALGGIYVGYDCNYHYLGMRGFLRPGDYNTRVLLLVDGHKTNDGLYDTAAIGTEFLLDVDMIERVEVVRGPSSSLYGANAFFGVINVITKRGRNFDGFELSGAGGSQLTYKGRGTYGKRFSSGVEALVSASYYGSDGADSLHFKEFDTGPGTGVVTGLDGDKAARLFGSASYRDVTFEGGFVTRDKEIPTAPWGFVFGDPRAGMVDTAYFADLRYETSLDTTTSLTARIGYHGYVFEGDYPFDFSEDGVEPPVVVNRDEAWGDTISAETFVRRVLWESNTAIVGLQYVENFRLLQKNFYVGTPVGPDGPMGTQLDDDRDTHLYAAFIQDEWRIFSFLVLNAGARYDHWSTFGGSFSPRVALVASPLDSTSIKLMYGQAFRAPNAYEMYYHDGPLTAKPNPDLGPETIETEEVAIEQRFGDTVRASLSGYHYFINDLITQIEDPGDGLLQFANLDEVEAWGTEAELEARWKGVEARVAYALQKAEHATEGHELANSPRHMPKGGVSVPLWKDKVFLSAEALYLSSRKTLDDLATPGAAGPRFSRAVPSLSELIEEPGPRSAPAFLLLNTTLYAQNVLLDGLQMSAGVYNLLDSTYVHPGAEEHEQDVIQQDGRLFRIKLTWAF